MYVPGAMFRNFEGNQWIITEDKWRTAHPFCTTSQFWENLHSFIKADTITPGGDVCLFNVRKLVYMNILYLTKRQDNHMYTSYILAPTDFGQILENFSPVQYSPPPPPAGRNISVWRRTRSDVHIVWNNNLFLIL